MNSLLTQPWLMELWKPIGILLGLVVASRLIVMPMVGGGFLALILRFPGNVIHEFSHALAVIVSGYTVSGFGLSLFCKDNIGYVKPGRPFLPWADETLLRILAGISPLPAGIMALCLLGWYVGDVVQYTKWQTWISAILAVSFAAELSPSDQDINVFLRPTLLVFFGFALIMTVIHLFLPNMEQQIIPYLSDVCDSVSSAGIAAAETMFLGMILLGPILLFIRYIKK